MTRVKYGSQMSMLRKADEGLLNIFQRNCLRIVLDIRLNNWKKLHEKCGSIPISRAIKKERLRWLGHALRMNPS